MTSKRLQTKGKLLGNYPCPECRAAGGDNHGDNLSIYLDEESYEYNGWCWSCEEYFSGMDFQEYAVSEVDKPRNTPGRLRIEDVSRLTSESIKDRRISKETTAFYGVKSELDDEGFESKRYYPITKKSEVIGYKCRKLPKEFDPRQGATPVGSIKQSEFFGQSKFSKGSNVLLITCGEEDALAAYQMTKEQSRNNIGYAAVSAPGAAHIVKLVKENLDWLSTFEKVVFAVDQENLDLEKAREACSLLPPKKGYVCKFEEKDCSDMCAKGKAYEFYKAVWNSEPWKPEGIILGSETWEAFTNRNYKVKGTPLPELFGLDNYLGIVKGNIDVIGAFEKAGKSTFLKEIILHLHETTDEKIGLFMLEEFIEETVTDLMVMKLKERIDINEDLVSSEVQKDMWCELFGSNRITLSTAHSFATLEDFMNKIRYMHHNYGVDIFFLDNLTKMMRMLVDIRDNENFIISKIMTELDVMAKDLGIYICLVSHVRKEDGYGKSFNEGKVMKVHDLYGSGDISKFAHNVIAISRNNESEPNCTTYHLIASRRGKLGRGNELTYNYKTGRMELLEETGEEEEVL